jgi:hypothetical protein
VLEKQILTLEWGYRPPKAHTARGPWARWTLPARIERTPPEFDDANTGYGSGYGGPGPSPNPRKWTISSSFDACPGHHHLATNAGMIPGTTYCCTMTMTTSTSVSTML